MYQFILSKNWTIAEMIAMDDRLAEEIEAEKTLGRLSNPENMSRLKAAREALSEPLARKIRHVAHKVNTKERRIKQKIADARKFQLR